jgi:hypothetical protein
MWPVLSWHEQFNVTPGGVVCVPIGEFHHPVCCQGGVRCFCTNFRAYGKTVVCLSVDCCDCSDTRDAAPAHYHRDFCGECCITFTQLFRALWQCGLLNGGLIHTCVFLSRL